MSETPGSEEPQGPSGDVFADVPLFREIQRVLFSGSGPINWELARQVGIAVAVGEQGDPEPAEEDREELEQTVRAAELAVADHTGMEPPAEVAHVRPVRRARWVEANIKGLRTLFEPSAERLARALAEAQKHELGEERQPGLEGFAGLNALMERMGPLLMGSQVGMVLGHLGRRVLGQYELPVPREEQAALLFVVPNIVEFEREWDLPRREFRAWVALHETTHAFQLGRPWVRRYFVEQLRALAEGMEFDLTALEERLSEMDLTDPERLSEALGEGGELLGQTLSPEQQLIMRRLQALMVAAEGHADHVMGVVGRRLLTSYGQIDEATRRRHEGRGRQERMLERMLGIELKQEQYRLGRAFCERVAEATDEATLARMWESPEALPSMPELEEPALWLARIV